MENVADVIVGIKLTKTDLSIYNIKFLADDHTEKTQLQILISRFTFFDVVQSQLLHLEFIVQNKMKL